MARRKIPTSIKDYILTLSETKDVINWIKKEVIDVQSKKYIGKTVIWSFCNVLLMLLSPMAIGEIFSGIVSHSINEVTFGISATIICLYTQRYFDRKAAKAREWIFHIHWSNMDKRMTELFFEKSPGQHIQESSLAVSSVDKGRWNMLNLQGLLFFEAIPVILQLSMSIALLFYVSWQASGLMVLAVCIYVAYSFYLNFNVMKVCAPIDRSLRRLNRKRVERMEKAIRVIVSSQEKREVSEMTAWFEEEITKDTNFWIWFIETAKWRSIANILLFGAILAYGSKLAWSGLWQVGMLYPLFSWSTRIIDNIWHLGDIEHKINWSLPSIKSMIAALSMKPDIVDVSGAVAINSTRPERIVIDCVSHIYDKKEEVIDDDVDEDPDDEEVVDEEADHTLKKISFTIEPGEKVALLGPSGAGKTTLMRLLLRFMDPTSGSISVGGFDLCSVARDSWMKCIGYIAQQPEVFDGTVRENLVYRLSDDERLKITDEELWKLMRRLEIDFGKRLNKGLETRVGKHGLKLSGGQAQRLMIGAAVIGNPWFMVIDEATSSLDSTTERKVQDGLAKILSGNTSALVVAHRLSTVRHLCSKFVVLKPATETLNGDSQVEAVASSFEELYKISPTFRQLADDQEVKIV